MWLSRQQQIDTAAPALRDSTAKEDPSCSDGQMAFPPCRLFCCIRPSQKAIELIRNPIFRESRFRTKMTVRYQVLSRHFFRTAIPLFVSLLTSCPVAVATGCEAWLRSTTEWPLRLTWKNAVTVAEEADHGHPRTPPTFTLSSLITKMTANGATMRLNSGRGFTTTRSGGDPNAFAKYRRDGIQNCYPYGADCVYTQTNEPGVPLFIGPRLRFTQDYMSLELKEVQTFNYTTDRGQNIWYVNQGWKPFCAGGCVYNPTPATYRGGAEVKYTRHTGP